MEGLLAQRHRLPRAPLPPPRWLENHRSLGYTPLNPENDSLDFSTEAVRGTRNRPPLAPFSGTCGGRKSLIEIRFAAYAWLMAHSSSPPSERIAVRIFRTASSRRVLMVPNGMPVLAAISRWLSPR